VPTINEHRLCEAVIRLLEADRGARRQDVTFPEQTHVGPPVEIRLAIGDKRFALEHTLVEPFIGAIGTGHEFEEFVRPIHGALDQTLPTPGTYQLFFPLHPTVNRPRKHHAALRAAIIEWVRTSAAEMHAEYPTRLGADLRPRGYEDSRETEIDGLLISLKRVVHWSESGRHDGRLFPYRLVGDDVEPQRRARINIALDKKLPKLKRCQEEGDATVLILEYGDVALTNQVFLAQALEAALADRSFWPNHIILADTTCAGEWHLFRPVIDGAFTHDLPYIDVPKDLSGRSTL
jgi:hypothetical protein